MTKSLAKLKQLRTKVWDGGLSKALGPLAVQISCNAVVASHTFESENDWTAEGELAVATRAPWRLNSRLVLVRMSPQRACH